MTRAQRLEAAAKIADRHGKPDHKKKPKPKPKAKGDHYVSPYYLALRKAHDGRPYSEDKR